MKQNICKAVVYSLLTMTSVNAAAAGLFKPSSAGSNSILQSRQALAGQLNLRANRQRFDLLKGSDGKFTNQMQKFDGYSKGAMGTTGKAADLQNSSAGPNIGGGGYGYYDSSTKHLKTVISILKNSFKFLTEEDFAKINEYFAKRTAELKIKDSENEKNKAKQKMGMIEVLLTGNGLDDMMSFRHNHLDQNSVN